MIFFHYKKPSQGSIKEIKSIIYVVTKECFINYELAPNFNFQR